MGESTLDGFLRLAWKELQQAEGRRKAVDVVSGSYRNSAWSAMVGDRC